MINENQTRAKNLFFKYMDLGLRFAVAIFLGVYAGNWLDSKLTTRPLFLLLGLFIGAGSGFWSIYKAVFPPDKSKQV